MSTTTTPFDADFSRLHERQIAHPLRLLVVHESTQVRGLVREALSRYPNLVAVVAEAATAEVADAILAADRPQLVIAGLRLPDRRLQDALATWRKIRFTIRILLLLPFDDPAIARACLQAGVRGYVHAEATPDELAHLLTEVAAGRLAVSRQVTAKMPAPTLDDPQHRLLGLLAEGHDVAAIAARLKTPQATVQHQLAALAHALGLQSVQELRIEAALLGFGTG